MNDLVYVGFASSAFGINGEIKVLSDLNYLDRIFKVGNTLIIDDNKYTIVKSHFHKNNYLVTFAGYEDINKIDFLLKKDLYINRKDIDLKDDEYLYSDLINCNIIDDNKKIGKVDSILFNKKDIYIKTGNLIIPLIEKYLEKIDIYNKIVYVKNTGELVL